MIDAFTAGFGQQPTCEVKNLFGFCIFQNLKKQRLSLLSHPLHLSKALRKQKGLWFVIGGFQSVLCVSVFQRSLLCF